MLPSSQSKTKKLWLCVKGSENFIIELIKMIWFLCPLNLTNQTMKNTIGTQGKTKFLLPQQSIWVNLWTLICDTDLGFEEVASVFGILFKWADLEPCVKSAASRKTFFGHFTICTVVFLLWISTGKNSKLKSNLKFKNK